MLYDRGDGIGAMPAAQMAELAGHPRVAVLLGGIAAWPGELASGQVELEPVQTCSSSRGSTRCRRATSSPRGSTIPALTILDVRREEEFTRQARLSVRPAPGPHPGRAQVTCRALFAGPGQPLRAGADPRARRRARRGEVVAYCHSGSRSALATLALRAGGLPRAQLRGLVARVVAPRRAADRALEPGRGAAARPRRHALGGSTNARRASRPSSFHASISLARLREQRVGVDAAARSSSSSQLSICGERHLGVELDAPRAVAEPERLRADAAARQLDRARRDAVGVVVPLERLEAPRQARRGPDRPRPRRVSSTSNQPISASRAGRPVRAPPSRAAARRGRCRASACAGRAAAAGRGSPRAATGGGRPGRRASRRRRRARRRRRRAAAAAACPRQGSTPRAGARAPRTTSPKTPARTLSPWMTARTCSTQSPARCTGTFAACEQSLQLLRVRRGLRHAPAAPVRARRVVVEERVGLLAPAPRARAAARPTRAARRRSRGSRIARRRCRRACSTSPRCVRGSGRKRSGS